MTRGSTASPAGLAGVRGCIIGDSIVTGTGDETALGWSGRIAAQALTLGQDLTLYALGIRGDTTLDVARRWRHEAEVRLPGVFRAVLVFGFGLNDCAVRSWEDGAVERRVPLEVSVATARTVWSEAAAWLPTLAIGPAPVDDLRDGPQLLAGVRQRTVNRDIREIDVALSGVAADLGIPYLTVFDRLSRDRRWQRALTDGDGVHPTADGYAVLAAAISDWDAWRLSFRASGDAGEVVP